MPHNQQTKDPESIMGAVEQDRPDQKTNVAPLEDQLDHRYQDPLLKSNDSGMPEHGQHEEFSMEKQGKNQVDQDTNADINRSNRQDPDGNAEGELNDQNPGQRQKQNQGDKKDDDLAA